jgi:hypothetical protein
MNHQIDSNEQQSNCVEHQQCKRGIDSLSNDANLLDSEHTVSTSSSSLCAENNKRVRKNNVNYNRKNHQGQQQSSSFLSTLPKELYRRITDYISSPEDVLALASTCKKIKDDLNVAILDDKYSSSQLLINKEFLNCEEGTMHKIWFQFLHPLPQSQIHTIQLKCSIVYDGYVLRTGHLTIYEDDNENDGNDERKVVYENKFPMIIHSATHMKIEFHPKPGCTYTTSYMIKNGNNHHHIEPSIRFLTYNREFVRVANTFQNDLLLTNCTFGIQMMIALTDLMIRNIERGEDQDVVSLSPLASRGFDISSADELNSIKDYFTNLLEFRFERERQIEKQREKDEVEMNEDEDIDWEESEPDESSEEEEIVEWSEQDYEYFSSESLSSHNDY